MSEDELRQTCKKLSIDTDESMGKGRLIDEIFGEKCESNYVQPTFITDYPVEMSPLCKKHRDNSELTERFELMVNGKELANAYSELNDPIDQKERFEEQVKLAEKGDDEAMLSYAWCWAFVISGSAALSACKKGIGSGLHSCR